MPASTTQPVVLVVDDSQTFRDLCAKLLAAQGFVPLTAVDGADALAKLASQPVHAVLSDVEMPRINGLALLKAIRNEPRFKTLPVILLTSTLKKEYVVEASQLGVNGFLLKPQLSVTDLVTRLRGAIAKASAPAAVPAPYAEPQISTESLIGPAQTAAPAAPAVIGPRPSPRVSMLSNMSVPNLVTKDATIEAVTQVAATISLADVASAFAGDASKSLASATLLLKQDPDLADRVMKLAKSPAFANPAAPAHNLEEAARTLGPDGVRQLAVARMIFNTLGGASADADFARCQQHAVAVGLILKRIAPRTAAATPGLPFLVGLCHDLAEMVLRHRFPGEYAAAADFARQAEGTANELLRQVFGIPYAELTSIVLEKLKVPPAIAEPINQYFAVAGYGADGHQQVLPRALAMADFFASAAFCTASADELVAPIQQADCHGALIPSTVLGAPELRAESQAIIGVLATADQKAALDEPLLPRAEAKVWYVRHASFAALDPIEVGLAGLCKILPHDRLPTADECDGLAGLVITSPILMPGIADLQKALAQAKKKLPTFNITRTDPTAIAAPAGGVEESAYPIPLRRLANFVAGLAT